MEYESHYVAKKPDANGIVHYSAEEDLIWHDLYERQIQIVKGRACQEYLNGLNTLNMSQDHIPQLWEMNAVLTQATGWGVEPVPAIIPFHQFFELLSRRRFPAATFIRNRVDFDYIKEPDIFHEYFGHCPMLTEPIYADFMQAYGDLGKTAQPKEQVLLARLYWFTVEFGLIHTPAGIRIYGGGILSSPEETVYALESPVPIHQDFNILDALRTPYRIDIKQPIYFVIDTYQELYDLVNNNLIIKVNKALALDEHKG